MKISEILKVTAAVLISGDPIADIDPGSISIDSRSIKKGEFFLPLKGANFNGEDFIQDAFKKGAIGAFTTQCSAFGASGRGKIIMRVRDTTRALQRMARYNRRLFDIPVIGVTGSNGKTTVKDMIAKVLSSKFNVLKNEGTKNNHIGLPLTLLKLNSSHRVCVVEMGTNHRGEISFLGDIAAPNIAVITNIGPSHLEFLKDLNGVFREKRDILEALDRDSLAVINGDDKYLAAIKKKPFKIMRFGYDDRNDFRSSRISSNGTNIEFFLNDRSRFELNLIGAHNVYNALAAIAVAYNFDISYEATKRALSEYSLPDSRLNVRDIGGITVIDDAYNSNPLSMKSAIETLAEYPAKRRWIVSADMLELGRAEEELHGKIGEMIARSGFSGLITYGKLSKHTSSRALECGMGPDRVWHCSSREEAADILSRVAGKGDAILVKGSRAMKMEEVIKNLKGL